MYKIDFSNPINVHFIGIGGISMSGLAEILIENSFTVSGSDMNNSDMTTHLKALGVNVFIGHRSSNIPLNTDLVVYTAAIAVDNSELVYAKDNDIPVMDRAELLGQIMSNYSCSIGVSGTHGKTTTTSMLSNIFIEAKKDPTITVGGILDIISGNIKIGGSEFFITEACEYANSFLKFHPTVAIVLNVEEDHLDFFKDLEEIKQSFSTYLSNVPDSGFIVINSDIKDYKELVKDKSCTIITYGSNPEYSDWYPQNIVFDSNGHGVFDLYYKGSFFKKVNNNATGMHNIYNSIAAIAASICVGIDEETAVAALSDFASPRRRFEYKGSLHDIKLYDDYAHHPTEIKATIEAAKKFDYNKLWVVFQPHTYSRTKAFLEDFAAALSLADQVIVTDIYAAREKDPGDIHANDLVNIMKKNYLNCRYISSFDEIEYYLLQNLCPKDMLITMGAGNINLIGEDLIKG